MGDWLVVGLGNPGPRYADTRHNVGFHVLERLAPPGASFRARFNGELASGTISGCSAALLRPLTFMNESGRAVLPAMGFFKVPPAQLVVIHDELDLPFSEVRVKVGGGHGGHNGLRSIIAAVGADFVRVRVGIGRPPPDFGGDTADFVLQAFAPTERAALPEVLARAEEAVRLVLSRGAEHAMNLTNRKAKR